MRTVVAAALPVGWVTRPAPPAVPVAACPFVLPAHERQAHPRADAGELPPAFGTPLYPDTILFSAGSRCGSRIVSLLLAYPLAYLLAFKVKRHKNLMYMAVIIPLWVSYLVRAYAWKIILGQEGHPERPARAAGRSIDQPLDLPALQQVGGDPRADPHLHPLHPDADLRGAGGDPAGAQGSEPGPVRQPLADLPPRGAPALAPRRAGGLHLRLRAEHGRLHRARSSWAATTARSWCRTWW